jgi:hypothetical protein
MYNIFQTYVSSVNLIAVKAENDNSSRVDSRYFSKSGIHDLSHCIDLEVCLLWAVTSFVKLITLHNIYKFSSYFTGSTIHLRCLARNSDH